jgi:hypothetical protein
MKNSIILSKNTLLHEVFTDNLIEQIDKTCLDGNDEFIKTMLIDRIKHMMNEKNVKLTPKNKNGSRLQWQKKLENDLNITFEGYEKKLFNKLKHTEIEE